MQKAVASHPDPAAMPVGVGAAYLTTGVAVPAKGPLSARGRSHRHSRHTDRGNAVIRGCSHASREQGKKGQMTMEEVTPPPTR